MAVRQNALATGPVSESRTKIAAKPMLQPPAMRATKGSEATRGPWEGLKAVTQAFSHGATRCPSRKMHACLQCR